VQNFGVVEDVDNSQTVRPSRPQTPMVMVQDQRSLTEQLETLVVLANQAGLYDAADYVQTILNRRSPRKA
jgi:hypothetical protein